MSAVRSRPRESGVVVMACGGRWGRRCGGEGGLPRARRSLCLHPPPSTFESLAWLSHRGSAPTAPCVKRVD
ncbi:hypothetical protein IG631_12688 [Alternaria alternata]|nr:hypothetical protein IG631_12688 [Alternaria alternata]